MSRKRNQNGFARVNVRFRPLLQDEIGGGYIEGVPRESNCKEFSLQSNVSNRTKVWKFSFDKVYCEKENNRSVYEQSIKPLLSDQYFGTVCCFAYGHSGSGKSHTIIGYGQEYGIFRHTVEELSQIIQNQQDYLLKICFSEIHNGKVYDLLNKRGLCEVRDDGSGNFCVRSQTQVDESNGNVRVNPLTYATIRQSEEALRVLEFGIGQRAVGNSTIHDQSSRSHAVLEVEVVNQRLLDLRESLIMVESEIHPIGKKRDDLKIQLEKEEFIRDDLKKIKISLLSYKMIDGKWCNVGLDDPEQEKELTAQMEILESNVQEKQNEIDERKRQIKEYILTLRKRGSLIGSTVIFIDLAGSDYENVVHSQLSQEEKKESKMINVSLLSVKECIRGISSRKRHIPFRNSKLTMVLKKSLLKKKCKVVMISTASPSFGQEKATLNTLKYSKLFSRT